MMSVVHLATNTTNSLSNQNSYLKCDHSRIYCLFYACIRRKKEREIIHYYMCTHIKLSRRVFQNVPQTMDDKSQRRRNIVPAFGLLGGNIKECCWYSSSFLLSPASGGMLLYDVIMSLTVVVVTLGPLSESLMSLRNADKF